MERPLQSGQNSLPAVARFERLVLVVAVVGLVLTGLPQRYAGERWAHLALVLLGGIESARFLHRVFAVLLLAVAIYHMLAVIYQRWVFGRRSPLLPLPGDWRSLVSRVLGNFGFRTAAPADGRFALRIEYLVVVVSIAILIVTGLILWNPVAVAATLPGETVPVALSVHSNHALLFVGFIILWEILVLFLWRSRRSAAEASEPPVPAEEINRRRRRFLPVALLAAGLLAAGLIWFLTSEQTAISTVPRRQAVVFAPQMMPETGDAHVGAAVWATSRCAFCHGEQAGGGANSEPALRPGSLTFDAFYQKVRQGTEKMPAFSPEELPDAYLLHLWAWLSESPQP